MATIVEAIRGLGLGGAETLLAQRIRSRVSSGPDGERRAVLNTAPSIDYFASELERHALVEVTRNSSIPTGILHTFRLGRRMGPGDVVVSHSPAAGIGFKLATIGRRRRFAMIDVIHNTDYRPVYVALGRVLNSRVDLAVSVSEAVDRAATANHYRRKVVVHGGVDRQRIRDWIISNPDAFADLRGQINVPLNARLVCNVANLNPRKNQQVLLEAIAKTDAHLVIVGEGVERANLERLTEELGLEDRVHLIGRQPDAWRWIAVSDLVGHPSIHEGLPVALMEAAVLRVPMFTSYFGGIYDVKQHADVAIGFNKPEFLREFRTAVMTAPPAAAVWRDRAAEPHYFDLERFVEDFYSAISSARKDRSNEEQHAEH